MKHSLLFLVSIASMAGPAHATAEVIVAGRILSIASEPAAPLLPEVKPELINTIEQSFEPATPTAMPSPAPLPTLILRVDLTAQQVAVHDSGTLKFTWPISSGTREYATPTGTFTPTWTSKLHYSRQWDWAPMHHSVFFNKGVAFHATTATRMLGQPASHGCIRLAPANAKTLFNLVHAHGLKMTRVEVAGTPLFEDAPAARRRPREQYAGRPHRYDSYGSFTTYAGSEPTYYYGPRRRRYVAKTYGGNPFGSFWD